MFLLLIRVILILFQNFSSQNYNQIIARVHEKQMHAQRYETPCDKKWHPKKSAGIIIQKKRSTVNPLHNDFRYNSKIRYKLNAVCTFIDSPMLFLGKHTVWIFVRIVSPKKYSKVFVIHALDGFMSSFIIIANSILQQKLW